MGDDILSLAQVSLPDGDIYLTRLHHGLEYNTHEAVCNDDSNCSEICFLWKQSIQWAGT
jgi:hypothetical protein